MHFLIGDRDYEADLDWKEISVRDFYDVMRGGRRILSSAVNLEKYKEIFEEAINDGYDVLSLSTTYALSNSFNISCAAKNELTDKYPDSKIICIDTSITCSGLTILCIKAAQMRAEGKTIEEVAEWVQNNKKFVNQEGTVEKLEWLKKAGRVSFFSAFFGDIIGVKPIIVSDVHGYNAVVEKVKGRKASFRRMAERVAEEYIPNEFGIFINHADCIEDALLLKKMIIEKVGVKEDEITIGIIGPIIGASVGPGTVIAYFMGTEVTVDSLEKNKENE